MSVTFITGNQNKINFMQKHLGMEFKHQKVNLEEIQSMNLKEISEYKARQAYKVIKSPVLVEDVGLYCKGMGGLPGPFVKWFLETVGTEGICRLANSTDDNSAQASIVFTYFDGREIRFFEGQKQGKLAPAPRGELGYGWDATFIPDGSEKTYGEMDDQEVARFGLRTTTVFPEIRNFLKSLDNS